VEQPVAEVQEQASSITDGGNPSAKTISPVAPAAHVSPQACGTCGTVLAANSATVAAPSWVYALGNIESRFPSVSVEKEFAQATGREKTAGLTDRQALHAILSKPENRYLVRQLCFVLTIEGLETYLLRPRDPADFSLLVEAVRPSPSPMDLDLIIGIKGPLAPPEICNGLIVPIVAFDQIYSFERKMLVASLPREGKGSKGKEFDDAAEELFDRIIQMTDNAGAMDEHRALNYLAVRYHAIYAKAAEYFARDYSLTAVHVRASGLSGVRKLAEVIFSYTNRSTDVVDKCFVRVDVTDEFPFLVTKLSPYYDH
jgi:hypothetical protein